MICAWKDFLKILPEWMRADADRQGSAKLQELRLRLGRPPELICPAPQRLTERNVTTDDLNFCINTASRYSPWATDSIRQGFLTTAGGHRIGICGQTVISEGEVRGIRTVTSLCIRIARDFPGLSANLAKKYGSLLIIGPPGSGKTTLLRDLIRQKSNAQADCIGVVDERGELFPPEAGFDTGQRTDVLTGCGKAAGIDMILRCMGPSIIAVDEITAEGDCDSLLRAGRCGVSLLATAHAESLSDLHSRPIYRNLDSLFDWIVILRPDKTWSVERMVTWI